MTDPDFSHLPAIRDWVFARLEHAAGEPGDQMRWAVLASRSEEDGVSARTLVLRELDQANRLLTFFSDARAPKIAELRKDPRVCLVLLDADTRIQLRAYGAAKVFVNPKTVAPWRRQVPPHAEIDYSTLAPPGTEADTYSPDLMRDVPLDTFAVMQVELSHIDILKLGRRDHRRALIDWRPDAQSPRLSWRVP